MGYKIKVKLNEELYMLFRSFESYSNFYDIAIYYLYIILYILYYYHGSKLLLVT